MGRPGTYVLVTGVMILAVMTLRLIDPAPLGALRQQLFNIFETYAPQPASPPQPVTHIVIDAESEARLGSWPWPDHRLQSLIERLKSSHAVAIGLALPLPSPPMARLEALLESLPPEAKTEFSALTDRLRQKLGNMTRTLPAKSLTGSPVVLSASPAPAANAPRLWPTPAKVTGLPPKIMQALPDFAGNRSTRAQPAPYAAYATVAVSPPVSTAQETGAPHFPAFFKSGPLNKGVLLYPSLPVALLARAQGAGGYHFQPVSHILPMPGREGLRAWLHVGDMRVPVDGQGRLYLEPSSRQAFQTIPAWRLLEGLAGSREIDGRIAVIGRDAASARQAQAIAQMLAGAQTSRPGYALALELAVFAGASVLTAFVVFTAGTLQGALIATTLAGGFAFLSWLSFEGAGLRLDPACPGLGIFAVLAVVTLLRRSYSRRERNALRLRFRNRAAPAIVEEIISQRPQDFYRPRRRDITMLALRLHGLPDIESSGGPRRFSRAAHRLADIIGSKVLAFQGTIEHFDGVFMTAVWNATVRDEDQDYHACLAFLDMLRSLRQFNGAMARKAKEKNRAYRPLGLSAGIATQAGLVGNLMLAHPPAFSIFSSARETAMALERAAVEAGLSCLISAQTVSAVPDLALIEAGPLVPDLWDQADGAGSVETAGEAGPHYALLGDDVMQRSETFRRLRINHERMLKALRARDVQGAEHWLRTCHILGGSELAAYYRQLAAKLKTQKQDSRAA